MPPRSSQPSGTADRLDEGPASALACRVCAAPLAPGDCVAFDPDPARGEASYLHLACARVARDQLAAQKSHLARVAPALLRACERAHRNALATMGPRADLTQFLAAVIAEARGAT